MQLFWNPWEYTHHVVMKLCMTFQHGIWDANLTSGPWLTYMVMKLYTRYSNMEFDLWIWPLVPDLLIWSWNFIPDIPTWNFRCGYDLWSLTYLYGHETLYLIFWSLTYWREVEEEVDIPEHVLSWNVIKVWILCLYLSHHFMIIVVKTRCNQFIKICYYHLKKINISCKAKFIGEGGNFPKV